MFDRIKLKHNRQRYAESISSSSFRQFIGLDLLERLQNMDLQNYHNVLVIENNFCLVKDFMPTLNKQTNITFVDDAEDITLEDNKFDLVIFIFGLHWINDIQSVLLKISKLLNNKGIFLANFAGGGSLYNLRKKIISIEHQHHMPHTPHIAPFIQFEYINLLLKEAGFNEQVSDMQKLGLERDNFILLMHFLKNIGEGNCIINDIHYSLNKRIYNELSVSLSSEEKNDYIIDYINLISFVATKSKGVIKLASLSAPEES
jgi:SAM-dependent methyltransferase